MRNNRGVAEIGILFAILAVLSLGALFTQDNIKKGPAKFEEYHTNGHEKYHGQGMSKVK